MRYRLVIFDFDGVLADSGPWFRSVLGEVAGRHGFRLVDDEELEALRGVSNREIVRRLKIPFWKLPAIAAHMRGLAREAAGEIPTFAGVEEMLERLHEAGVQIAVVSSNAEDVIRKVLGERTAALVGRYACGASMFGKAPLIRRVLRATGVTPAEALAVGDEPRDVEAAHRAGIDAAVALWGFTRIEAFDGLSPVASFTSVEELARFLVPDLTASPSG